MIEVRNISVSAGNFSLTDVSLAVPTGEYVFLMGKTGCGKTTLLETLCGLRNVRSGRILLMGKDVTNLKASERGIGYVPQDAALFNSMNVADHLGFALFIRRVSRKDIRHRVEELADWLELTPLLKRRPAGLSGGEKQRVALGRALAFKPHTLCLDEPLSALDRATRDGICGILERIREKTGVTTLHVSHNHDEAGRLADRILMMDQGQILPPRDE